MKPARMHRDIAALIFFLQSAPRTRQELMGLMGWNFERRGTHQRIASILNALRDEGLIEEGQEEPSGLGGRRKFVYRWVRPANTLQSTETSKDTA